MFSYQGAFVGAQKDIGFAENDACFALGHGPDALVDISEAGGFSFWRIFQYNGIEAMRINVPFPYEIISISISQKQQQHGDDGNGDAIVGAGAHLGPAGPEVAERKAFETCVFTRVKGNP